jgi:UDP-N-acetylmuramate dehydrogenase
MNTEIVFDRLIKAMGQDKVLKNEPMCKHTTFKVGGNASVFVIPSGEEDVVKTVNIVKELGENFFVLGNGSNILVSDKGYDGVVIYMGKNMSDIFVDGQTIVAQSGALLSKVASVAFEHSLSGFEFASGIPGSIGGAVYMNAGAYGGSMSDVVVKTRYIDNDGNIKEITGDNHEFSYRHSVFVNGGIILSTQIKLMGGNKEEIREEMSRLNKQRKEKQPLEYPSAGSTFKRPEGHFAGKLIEDSDLGGFSIGGAQVSSKHCGFIINKDNATCEDILSLISHVQKVVFEKYGVKLSPEIKMLGGDFK